MSKIEKSAIVGYSAEQMYRLVNDVDKYPEFIDGCSQSEVIESDENRMVARLHVSKSGFSNAFTTENELKTNEQISMKLLDGPFDYLIGIWNFIPLDEGACRIEFSLEFEFKSRLVAMAFGKAFKTIAESMMQAFIKRAKVLYGAA